MTDERTKPILTGTAGTDYERYLRTDELLALQKTADEVVHRDEHLFQAVHQSSELWLKLACTELDEAAALLAGDGVVAATRTELGTPKAPCDATTTDALAPVTSAGI